MYSVDLTLPPVVSALQKPYIFSFKSYNDSRKPIKWKMLQEFCKIRVLLHMKTQSTPVFTVDD